MPLQVLFSIFSFSRDYATIEETIFREAISMLFSFSPIRRRTFSCMRGDLTIRGTEYRPNGEKLPIAIVCHGFMANQQTVRQYTRVLAKIGYCAYCFDFCGGSVPPLGRSDGATTDMSVLTEVQDLEAVIRYAQSRPYTSDTLLLMGCSQGGMVSALTAAKHPDAVNRLVLFYPAFCIPDDARAGHMMMAHFDPQNLPEKIHCGPMPLGRCYPEAVMHMDVFREITPYTGRVLIVHGTADGIVKPDYAKKAAEAYANAELHLIDGGAHGFNRRHDAEAIRYLTAFAAL